MSKQVEILIPLLNKEMEEIFPCNLIKKCCDDFYDNLVSLSHIIDK